MFKLGVLRVIVLSIAVSSGYSSDIECNCPPKLRPPIVLRFS
jgi:hypothetical protein